MKFNIFFHHFGKILLSLLYVNSTYISVIYGQSATLANPFFKEPDFFISKWEQQNFNNIQSEIYTNPLLFFTSFEKEAYQSKTQIALSEIQKEATYLAQHRIKNNRRFLKKIFEHVHLQYLKKYRTYSDFYQLFDANNFDCVTGTALYALIFNEMGIGYELHETANHSYLIVSLGTEKALFESTDPLNGFITAPEIIEETQTRYAQEMAIDFNNLMGMVGHKKSIAKTLKVYSETISLSQLAGLYYYNHAVVYYNLKNYKTAVNALEKAYTLHPSKRILTLLLVAIQEVLKTENLNATELKRYIAKSKYYTHLGNGFFD